MELTDETSQKAWEWMLSSQMKISEIIKSLGFIDPLNENICKWFIISNIIVTAKSSKQKLLFNNAHLAFWVFKLCFLLQK